MGDDLTQLERVKLLRVVHACETLRLTIERLALSGTVSEGSREILAGHVEEIRRQIVEVAES